MLKNSKSGLTPKENASPLTLFPAQLLPTLKAGGCPECHGSAHLANKKLHSELQATAMIKCQHNLNWGSFGFVFVCLFMGFLFGVFFLENLVTKII